MNLRLLLSLLLLISLSACMAAPAQPYTLPTGTAQPSATPEPPTQTAAAEIAATGTADARSAMIVQAAIAQVTLQAATAAAAEATAQSARQTEQVLQITRDAAATADARALQATAVALSERGTATAIAVQIIQANLAATQAAATSTVQAESTRSALEAMVTENAFHTQATLDAASAAAMSTAQAARAKSAESAAERLAMTNVFIAWLQALAPVLALIGLAGVLYIAGWFWWRVNKTRLLHPNAAGAYPMVYDNGRVINAQRAFGPVVDPTRPTLPQDESIQGRIALADTQVGAVRAMAAGQRTNPEATARRVQQMAGGQAAVEAPPPFRIVPAERARQALPADVATIIDAQWQEVSNGSDHSA